MGFNPQDIEDAIRNAGAILAQQWKKPGGNFPENNLHPEPSALQFRLKLLEDRCELLEQTVGRLVRELNGRK